MAHEAAVRAWQTRREVAKKLTAIAKKAWRTRRENDRARKASAAARKAWRTRRSAA